MKKIVSILAIAITVPALATDITGSSDCDNDTLGTYSAPVDMEAKWTANTINLQWYDDANDSTPTNTMCTYNTTIALPTEPSKPGYNFAGWQLRQLFDLSTLNVNTDGISSNSKNFAASSCSYYNNQTEDSIVSNTCTESVFTSLNPGDGETTFNYGTIKSVAKCTDKEGDHHGYGWTGDPVSDWKTTDTEMAQASNTGSYCWCKPIGFAESNSNTYINVMPQTWIFGDFMGNGCATDCISFCSDMLRQSSDFRYAIFGIPHIQELPDNSAAD